MNEQELKSRKKEFVPRCIKLCLALPKNDLGNHTRGQLIRSSTSVTSNYRAACIAQSKASFIAKLSISIEEADSPREIRNSYFPTYLQLVISRGESLKRLVKPLLNEADELLSIFISSRKTASGINKN